MSVYTRIERNELEDFLTHYSLGGLIDFQGISAGIENTNYFVTTEGGEFVLTLFESLDKDELPYFLDLMAFLADNDIPSAHPMADNNGDYLRQLKTKPATLVRRLTGASVDQPGVTHCKVMGGQLGRLHKVGQSFQQHRDNDRGPHWWRETSGKLVSRISAEDAELLQNEVHFQSQYRSADLPCGVIHADLFRDNALFDGEELTGIIDFYYACNDALLYDLAVVVNDWCVLEDGALDKEKLTAFIGAYHQQRPLLEMERSAWPVMLRAGALRFWLSRMQDLHFPREGEITHSKDPEVFKRILLKHITSEGSGHPWI